MAYTGRAAGRAQSVQRLSDPVEISLTGDANGSISIDGSQDVELPVVVADDSHNHIIGNVDGLQTALDLKANSADVNTSLGTKVDKITSTDNSVVRFDGTNGALQNSNIIVDDFGGIHTSGDLWLNNEHPDGSGVVLYSNGYNLFLLDNYYGTLRINTNGINGIQINQGGIVSKPANPYFFAHHGSNTLTTGTILWGNVEVNNGNFYNPSTGRFSAPVEGNYHFTAWTLFSHSAGGEIRMTLYSSNGQTQRTITIKPVNCWWTVYVEATFHLAPGQTVFVNVDANPGTLYSDPGYNGFTGTLI